MARERPEIVRIGAAIMSGDFALQKGNIEVRMAVSGDIFFGLGEYCSTKLERLKSSKNLVIYSTSAQK